MLTVASCAAALKDAQNCLTVEELESSLTNLRQQVCASSGLYIAANLVWHVLPNLPNGGLGYITNSKGSWICYSFGLARRCHCQPTHGET